MSEPKITIIRNPIDVYDVARKVMASEAVEVDTETTGLDPLVDKVRLLQLGTVDEVFVIDVWATGSKIIHDCFYDFFYSTSILKIYMNAKFDLSFLSSNFGFRHRRIYDVMLASKVISNGIKSHAFHHSLAAIAKRYLDVTLDKELQRSDWSAEVLTDAQLQYAAGDVSILRRILYAQLNLIQEWGLVNTVKLENNAVIAISRMELDGVYVDPDMWQERIMDMTVAYKEAERKLKLAFNDPNINLNSHVQIKKALAAVGVVLESTGVKILEPLAKKIPIVAQLLNFRGLSKLLTSYGTGIPGAKRKKGQVFFLERVNPHTGRIHSSFVVVGPESGRTSCSFPNIQQVPNMRKAPLRQCFRGQINPLTGKRNKIIISDYSQVELRVLADLSGDVAMQQAILAGGDLHLQSACLIFNVLADTIMYKDPVTGKTVEGPNYFMRNAIKAISFGLVFGRGPRSLADTLGVSVQEAKTYTAKYFGQFSSVGAWLQNAAMSAVATRQARTINGRLRHFEFDYNISGERSSVEREGKNTPVQGSAADIFKLALFMVHTMLDDMGYSDMGVKMINEVHDEIQLECPEEIAEEVAVHLKRVMEEAGAYFIKSVPIAADCHVCDSWAEK